MRQNRVFSVYFSIIRRSAFCASVVIASASSKITNLKPKEGEKEDRTVKRKEGKKRRTKGMGEGKENKE